MKDFCIRSSSVFLFLLLCATADESQTKSSSILARKLSCSSDCYYCLFIPFVFLFFSVRIIIMDIIIIIQTVIVSLITGLIYFGKIESMLTQCVTCVISIRWLPEHEMKSMIISWNIKEKEAGFQQIHGKWKTKHSEIDMTHTEPWRLGASFTYQVINVIVHTMKMSNVEKHSGEKANCQIPGWREWKN